MTVVEHEVARETIAPITEREHRARTLEAAALELAVRGWLQDAACDDAGHVCLMAAIDLALPTELYDWLAVMEAWDPDWQGLWPDWPEAAKLPLADWNDVEGRTADDVTFLLRWRAQEIRDGR